MIDVVIAGIGQTPVGEHWNTSLRELSLMAIETVQEDSAGLQPQAMYVSNMLAARLSGQSHLGTLVADFAGMAGIEAVSVEAGGASGGVALRLAYLSVLSGEVGVALVVGVEKFTDQTGSTVEESLTGLGDSDYEAAQGLTPTAQAALLMQRYMYEFEAPRQAFASFPVVAHANGVANENAMFRRAIKVESYNRAGMVSDPLNMFDVAPIADGAAALMITRPELLPPGFPHPLVRIAGSGMVTDTLALHDRPDPLVFNAARLSVERALKQAGFSNQDIDFFELYDAYSVYSALSMEAAGFASRGTGWQFAQNGSIALDGSLPLSTMGGLKARGNPGGATGVYQVVEAALQLRGGAGDNQILGARRAMVQCLGGPASTAATHILEVMD
jgi:acetyl-CoA C-acetyltransferase